MSFGLDLTVNAFPNVLGFRKHPFLYSKRVETQLSIFQVTSAADSQQNKVFT